MVLISIPCSSQTDINVEKVLNIYIKNKTKNVKPPIYYLEYLSKDLHFPKSKYLFGLSDSIVVYNSSPLYVIPSKEKLWLVIKQNERDSIVSEWDKQKQIPWRHGILDNAKLICEQEASGKRSSFKEEPTILEFSRPVFFRGGNYCAFYFNSYYGGSQTGLTFVFMEKVGKQWKCWENNIHELNPKKF